MPSRSRAVDCRCHYKHFKTFMPAIHHSCCGDSEVCNLRNAVRVEMSTPTVTALMSTTSQAESTSVAETTGTTAKPVNITGK